jgi:hypothetical protein
MSYSHSSVVTKNVFRMPAYSAAYNPQKKDIEGGDKSQYSFWIYIAISRSTVR